MERIETLYHDTEGKCYLSFSGGKDSMVILALIKMCEEIYTIPPNAIPAVFCNTGIELGATIEFVRWVKDNYYSNVQVIRSDPKRPFAWIVKNKGMPVKSKSKSSILGKLQRNPDNADYYTKQLVGDNSGKFKSTQLANRDFHMLHFDFDIKVTDTCCNVLKKHPFINYDAKHDIKGKMLGERSAEGGARKMNFDARVSSGGQPCTRYRNGVTVKLPLIDWTDSDIECFIQQHNTPLSKAYTEQGYERTGCFLCPYSLQLQANLTKLHDYEPLRYKAAMHWLKDVYIAQGVSLPFDLEYEADRIKKWEESYSEMRYEMLCKYRPQSARKYKNEQRSLF